MSEKDARFRIALEAGFRRTARRIVDGPGNETLSDAQLVGKALEEAVSARLVLGEGFGEFHPEELSIHEMSRDPRKRIQ